MLRKLFPVASDFRWKLFVVALLFLGATQTSQAQADYAIQGAAVNPTSTAAGNSIYATGSIYNLGTAAGPSSNIGYYLSTNNTLDAADTFIGSSTGGTLNAGSTSSRYVYVTIPPSTASGSYYILFVADYLNAVSESNENNNVSSVSISVVPASVDFTIPYTYLYSSSVSTGAALTVEGSISNQGNTASSSSNVGFYLSSNATLESSDVFIGSYTGYGLGPGNSTSFYSSLTIPANTAPGTYYIIFMADYLNSVAEGNESNNTNYRQFTVIAPSLDLVILEPYLPTTTLSPGSSTAVSCYIYNQGNTPSPSSNVGYYLSTNNTLDAADTFVGSSTGGSLSANYSNYRSANITIPATTPTGSYYILYVADYLNGVSETNETNNVSSRSISVVAPYVDLYLQNAYLSTTSTTPGSALYGEFYIYNSGNTAASSSNVGVYLSTNNIFDANDAFIGSSSGSTLAANSYGYRSASFTIPSNTAAGNYYVFFVADYLGSVAESNENNNIAAMALSVLLPYVDLSLESVAVSASSVSAGNVIAATSTVRNSGNSSAASSHMGYYLSTNTTLDANDVLVGSSTGSAIAAGGSNYRNTSVTIPSNTTPGNYYLIQAVDYLNAITESNENNNTGSSLISVTAQGTTFLVPVSGSTSFTTCSGKVYDNGGTGPYTYGSSTYGTLTLNPGTSGKKVQLTFSNFSLSYYDYLEIYDGTSTSATLIGRYYSTSIPPVTTASNSSGALTLRFYNSGYYSGYYAGFEADIACVTPSVDLTMLSAYTSSTSLSPGSSFTSNSFVANVGTTTSAISTVGYYLSANATFESTDLYLGATAGGSLANGTSAERRGSMTLPSSVTAGSYNLLFVADPSNEVDETNEGNNVRTVPITVNSSNFIDLTITVRTLAATSVTVGAKVNATATIKNGGNVAAPKNAAGFYLSTNTTLDQEDVLLGTTYTVGTLATGDSEVVSASLEIPAATKAGSYYVLFVPDPENHVAESNETNGIMTLELTVTNLSIDLLVQTPTLSSSSVLAGSSVTANSSLKNQGGLDASTSTLGYYLSTNNTFDAADVALTTTTGGSLAATASAAKSATLTIPTGTAAGSYYVLFVADPAKAVTESDEDNNVASVALTVIEPTVDLVLKTPALSVATVLTGNTVAASVTIENTGTVAASNSTVHYFLSANNTYEATDVALGSSTGGSLAAATSAAKSETLTIPAGTAAGTYFVLFVADKDNTILESNEGNNVQNVKLTVLTPYIDLVVQNATVSPASAVVGTTVTANSVIMNNGTVAAASSVMGYYLSTNSTFESTDVALGTSTGASLGAGEASAKTASLTIPAGTAPGSYYILFMADPSQAVSESNENNNLSAAILTLTAQAVALPDLVVTTTAGTPAGSTIPGGTIQAAGTVSNQGEQESAASKITYYLSENEIWDNADTYLGETPFAVLAVGGSSAFSKALTVPAGTPFKEYYILMVADAAVLISEKNEANNVASFKFTVKDPNGIKELAAEHNLSLWPNPATHTLNIEAKGFRNGEKAADITVYSATGQKVLSKKAPILQRDLNTTLDVTTLNHGLYLVYIKVGDTLTIRRVMVQK
ncbi:CARDB domain-containing protein [Rufibacter soli]